MRVKAINTTEAYPDRKRACINCGNREPCGAGSECKIDEHYISYTNTWDSWCRHWKKDRFARIENPACFDQENKQDNL